MAITDEKESTRNELVAVDLSSKELAKGPTRKINPDADAWETPPPPPDDRHYRVKLFKARQFAQLGKTDDGEEFYRANLELRIVSDEKYARIPIFSSVSSYIGQGREISRMVGLMKKMGVTIKNTEIADLDAIRALAKVLDKEPQLWIEGQWRAWSQEEGRAIVTGMVNFPQADDGSHHHIVKDKTGTPCAAKFNVTGWWGLKEYETYMAAKKEAQKFSGAGGGVKGARKEEEVFEEVKVNAAPALAPAPVPAAQAARVVPASEPDEFEI